MVQQLLLPPHVPSETTSAIRTINDRQYAGYWLQLYPSTVPCDSQSVYINHSAV